MSARHLNTGNCPYCDQIFDRYPDFNVDLRKWFKRVQLRNPEAHISCAGRGKIDQEALKIRGASRAGYGSSAHNFGMAIDIFCNQPGQIYPSAWFEEVIGRAITPELIWYGQKGSVFYELPHVEIRSWRAMAQAGQCRLVEPNLKLV